MNFRPVTSISNAFADVVGTPARQERRGYGSFLTFEFGEPHIEIREPIDSTSKYKRVRRLLARRRAFVRGDWHLWIYCCDWKVTQNGKRMARRESKDDKIARAVDHL